MQTFNTEGFTLPEIAEICQRYGINRPEQLEKKLKELRKTTETDYESLIFSDRLLEEWGSELDYDYEDNANHLTENLF